MQSWFFPKTCFSTAPQIEAKTCLNGSEWEEKTAHSKAAYLYIERDTCIMYILYIYTYT